MTSTIVPHSIAIAMAIIAKAIIAMAIIAMAMARATATATEMARARAIVILGFHVTSQALLKSVSAMLSPSGVKFMLITGHLYSETSVLSVNYFANYMNIQKEKKNIKVPGIHLKVSQCSLSTPKA